MMDLRARNVDHQRALRLVLAAIEGEVTAFQETVNEIHDDPHHGATNGVLFAAIIMFVNMGSEVMDRGQFYESLRRGILEFAVRAADEPPTKH